jgi:hypothetical protein
MSRPNISDGYFDKSGNAYRLDGKKLVWIAVSGTGGVTDEEFVSASGSLQTQINAVAVGDDPANIQAYRVGKQGSDSNDGLHPDRPFLTFGAAISAINGQSPAADNKFVVVCLDAGLYTEDLTIPDYTHLFAPGATLSGTVGLQEDSTVELKRLVDGSSGIAVLKFAGTGTATFKAEEIETYGSMVAVACAGSSSVLMADVDQIRVESGAAIGDVTQNDGHIHLRVGDIYISGNGIGIARYAAGTTVGHVDHILEIGAGVGIGFRAIAGEIAVSANVVSVTNAWNITSPGVLNLIVNTVDGGRLGNGTINLISSQEIVVLSGTYSESLVPPRLTDAEKSVIAGQPSGSTIFNTTSGTMNVYDGASWRTLAYA